MQRQVQKQIEKQLARHACYVLVTCDSPSPSGEMRVEMSYQGDALLAAYLLEGASSVIEGLVDSGVEQKIEDFPFNN